LDVFRVPDSYIKAEDPLNYAEVIEIANRAGQQDDLVRYQRVARKTLCELKIDTEHADILDVGEKCFNDELYQAAKLPFTSISNWARLATTLIYLGENQCHD